MAGGVVVLAGGTGGAKLARGMLDVVGPDALTVIANTADDVVSHGAHVSPDPDLIAFWLLDRIDERGWGLDGDPFTVMDHLRALGEDPWFSLGDEDLALGLARARRLAGGERLTEATAALFGALGVPARVLPMCDEPVRTVIRSGGRDWPFQEWMIRQGGKDGGVIEGVHFSGIGDARPTPEVCAAIAGAAAIVIGPSNPSISIGPILEVPGMREAIAAAPAGVVAVSPLVNGASVKGPTEDFLEWAGVPLTADGIAECYAGFIDGIVADEWACRIPTLETDVLMGDAASRARLAGEALAFAQALAARD